MHRTKTHFAARINHVATALERRGVRATYTPARPGALESLRAAGGSRPTAPELDEPAAAHRLRARRATATASCRSRELFSARGAGRDRASRRSRSSPRRRPASPATARQLRVRAGKEFVVRLHSYGRRARSRRPVVPHLRVAADARHREHVPRPVVEARVRRHVVLGAAAGRGDAQSRRSAGTATSTTSTC